MMAAIGRLSASHLSLHISSPDAADKALAESRKKPSGGEIFMHGQAMGLTGARVNGDRTEGCIALLHQKIAKL